MTLANALQTTTARDARARGITTAVDARRQFGATLVLQGTLLREGDKVRVNYDLIDATALRQLQTYTLSAASSDPFAIQDHLVEWAAGALALKLTDVERRTLIDHDTRNAVAREQYLQGYGYLTDSREPASVDRAIDRFTRALEIDRRYALAFAGLGRAYWQKYTVDNDPQWPSKAREACRTALEIDQHLSAAHVCLGMVSNGSGQYAEARAAYKKALESDELSDEGLLGLAFAEEHLGDFNAAEQTYRRAVERRPHYWAGSLVARELLSRTGSLQRGRRAAPASRRAHTRQRERMDVTRHQLSLYGQLPGRRDRVSQIAGTGPDVQRLSGARHDVLPDAPVRRCDYGVRAGPPALRPVPRGPGASARVYYWQGRKAEARALFDVAIEGLEQALQVNPNDVNAHLLLAEFQAKLGHQTEATAQLLAAGDVSGDPHKLLFGAIVYNHLGNRATALEWLEKASRKGLPKAELLAWIELDNLHNDPRFRAFVGGR